MKDNNKKKLTNPDGVIISHDMASITGDKRGKTYTYLEDKPLVEKLAHFVRERIPERVVHAKGAGAFGTFTCTKDMSQYTKAKMFGKVGEKTDLVVRFSTVGGESGSADTARDPRGFAVKFYTKEGNYDLVGNNTPIFFIRDGIKFPDFIHTQKRNPVTHLKDPNMMWDFMSLNPETLHQATILMSDRGVPKTYRNMHGFGSHAFMWYTDKDHYCWVKYHFKTRQGIKNLYEDEAMKLAGSNPDYATEDLFNAIAKKDFPIWDVYVQIMEPDQVDKMDFDPFDVTKVWYQKDFPLIKIGEMELNKNPENYFAEIEQVAFSPSRFIPGIAASPDKLLQARLFAYEDAHRYRLGTNYQQIPVNQPKHVCPYSTQRDGSMTVNGNYGGMPNYYPSTLKGAAVTDNVDDVPHIDMTGVKKGRFSYEISDVDFVQPKKLFEEVLPQDEKERLIKNTCGSLSQADINIQYRWAAVCYKCSKLYGEMLIKELKLEENKVVALSKMSNDERINNTLPKA